MAAPKTSTQANAEHEQIVRKVLAALKNNCHRVHTPSVMAWEVAAMHLALRRDYTGSDISYRGTDENGDTLYAVTADSHPGARYHVEVHPIAHPTCSCPAGRVGRPCKHAGLALAEWAAHFERARRAAEASECGEYDHLSREDRREMAAIAIRFHERREGRW